METIKLYHEQPFLLECNSQVMAIDPIRGIALNQSVAYPESGGQMGDNGVLLIKNNDVEESIFFSDTQKGAGQMLLIQDFPSIQIHTPVYHKVSDEDLAKFFIGQEVGVKVDIERRGLLTISHSGIHLVLMGLEKKFPGIYHLIKGCSIKPDGARLDFRTENKFSQDDVLSVQDYVQNLIAMNKEMFVFQHHKEPEAWYWQLDNYIIPCGGTHLRNTGNIGLVTVKKENLGKTTQRMSFSFINHKIPYHEYEK